MRRGDVQRAADEDDTGIPCVRAHGAHRVQSFEKTVCLVCFLAKTLLLHVFSPPFNHQSMSSTCANFSNPEPVHEWYGKSSGLEGEGGMNQHILFNKQLDTPKTTLWAISSRPLSLTRSWLKKWSTLARVHVIVRGSKGVLLGGEKTHLVFSQKSSCAYPPYSIHHR